MTPVQRLLITFEALGDAVMRCGFIRALAAGGGLDLAGRPYLALYAGTPGVGRTIDARCLERRRDPRLDILSGARRRLAALLQAGRYDEVICYQRDAERGLRRWLQVRLPGVRILEIPYRREPPPAHETDDGRRMLAALGLSVSGFAAVPSLDVAADLAVAAAARLGGLPGPVVCIQPGTALTTRPWWDPRRRRGNPKALPVATWAELVTRLLRDGSAGTILCLGSEAERTLAAAIRAAVPSALAPRILLDTVGLPVPAMAAVVRESALLVSIDTGPAHVAAAVGARVLVIFGPTDTARYAPRGPGLVRTVTHAVPCRPCHGTSRARACRDNICLRLMPVERIRAAVVDLLLEPRSATTG